MSQVITIEKSNKKDKKFVATVDDKHIHFGQKTASDYTIHGDKERKNRYVARHSKREDWTKKGIETAGYYSRWLLWNN